MPAPSEVRAGLRVGTPAEVADARTRTHLADGRCVGWYGAPGVAEPVVIDAELVDTPAPPGLATEHGAERFWERWTAAECHAKASGRPMEQWRREYGLPPARGVVHVRLGPVLVAVRPPAPTG